MSKIETETVISYNLAEDFAYISTRVPADKRKIEKLGIEPYRTQADYVCYRVPKKWIIIKKPRKLSEKQLLASRRNIQKARSRKK